MILYQWQTYTNCKAWKITQNVLGNKTKNTKVCVFGLTEFFCILITVYIYVCINFFNYPLIHYHLFKILFINNILLELFLNCFPPFVDKENKYINAVREKSFFLYLVCAKNDIESNL